MTLNTNTKFLEIERKYRAGGVDWDKFVELCKSLGPTKQLKVEGPDTYYLNGDNVLRWRKSREKSELTVKAKKNEKNSLVREEVDLDTGTNHVRTILRFIKSLGYKKAFRIHKKCRIFWFSRKEGDVSVVIYSVTCKGRRERVFVEIEADKGQEQNKSLELLDFWEEKLGLNPKNRESKNLYEIYSGKELPMAEDAA